VVNSANKLDAGIYSITLSAQIPQPSDPSGIKSVSTSFLLTVEFGCDNTVFDDRALADMTVLVG
jgi:hypothetical protein